MGFALFLSHEGVEENAKIGCRFSGLAPIQEVAEPFMSAFQGKESPAVCSCKPALLKSFGCVVLCGLDRVADEVGAHQRSTGLRARS